MINFIGGTSALEGWWTIYVEESYDVVTRDLHDPRITCDRGQPGEVLKYSQSYSPLQDFDIDGDTMNYWTLTVDLNDNVATLVDDETGEFLSFGNYTMISKEGLLIWLDSRVYHTTMRYSDVSYQWARYGN